MATPSPQRKAIDSALNSMQSRKSQIDVRQIARPSKWNLARLALAGPVGDDEGNLTEIQKVLKQVQGGYTTVAQKEAAAVLWLLEYDVHMETEPMRRYSKVLDDFLPKREGRVLQAFQETYKEWKTVLEVILPSLWNGTEMLQNQQRLWQAFEAHPEARAELQGLSAALARQERHFTPQALAMVISMYPLLNIAPKATTDAGVQVALPCCCVEAEAAKLARRRLVLILKEPEDCRNAAAQKEAAHGVLGFGAARLTLQHLREQGPLSLCVSEASRCVFAGAQLIQVVKAFAMSQPDSGRARAKSIGHYILGLTIGEGTFGKVKLGTHILTSERVAVKILEKERIVEVADVERVAREVHILKLIRHPHIVQLYEIIETRRQLYLIMEYASGGELFDYIVAKGRVPELEACRFFHQIIAGLEKVHAMNIVHRDLKPENLLLDEHKNIKIVDFGLSNVFRPGQLLKTACGSPCYAAPEMIAGHSYVPHLCDLWSCGVILFALVCGYLPFEDQNTSALYKKILAADYKTPKFISESVRDLISKLLTTDPKCRYNVPDVRAHPWYRQIPEASTPIPEEKVEQGEKQDMKLEEDLSRDLVLAAPGEGEVEVEEASELKSHGNAAYSRNDVEEAVRLWNLAIRKHVQELSDGKPCDEEATTLERSIYLNLAQGYLKLGDGERALRACKVVLFTDQENDKARFRAAEACLQLGRSQEAEQWLSKLDLPEASKMLQRIRWKSRAEAAKDSKQDAAARKKLAEKMSAGLSGFSEDKPPPVPQETVGMTAWLKGSCHSMKQALTQGFLVQESAPRAPMADLDTVSNMTDISAEVAQAAKNRLARMEAAAEGEQPLPEPTYTDFESFRAKAMKRSQKYSTAAERSRKQSEAGWQGLHNISKRSVIGSTD
eukprot:g11069.t1